MLIFDEVQPAWAAWASYLDSSLWGEPDVITLAQRHCQRCAIGAFMAKEKYSVFSPGETGTTFGGNPLACSAGYAVLNILLKKMFPPMPLKWVGICRQDSRNCRKNMLLSRMYAVLAC